MEFHRQLDIVSVEELNKHHITVIGVGGIGSPTVLALTKMGAGNITVYDDDKIEEHNLPNQIYRTKDLNKNKVDGIVDICKEFSGYKINSNNTKFDQVETPGIVISAVDSMAARKSIWDTVKYNPSVSYYIEARMGAEEFKIYTINPTDPDEIKMYEKTLYSDSEAAELPCTARAIIYNVFMIASLITCQVKKIVSKQDLCKKIFVDLTTLTLIAK